MPTKYNGTGAEKRALNAVIALMRAAGAMQQRFAAGRAADGLTMAQFAILETLLHCGPLCQRDLAVKLLVSGANITKVIDGLERGGMVERIRSKQDRRYISVALTAAGRRHIERIFPHHVGEVVSAFSCLSSGEQDALRVLCKKLGLANQNRRGVAA